MASSSSSSSSSSTPKPSRLIDVLRALPEKELVSLAKRLRIRTDARKRLDIPSQIARSLVALPEIRDPSSLPVASRQLLHRIAEAGGVLHTEGLPPGLQPLAAKGIVFARLLADGGVELLLPIAYLVQLPSWEGENSRCVRALLAKAPFETCSSVASHYLGRTASPPLSLALEAAWEALSDTEQLTKEVQSLAPAERRLLEAVDAEGGEVLTEELLELEREPMRLRGAIGATPSRRGAGFALERRGYLVSLHPNRHVIPTEVSAIVGAADKAEKAERRKGILDEVKAGDYQPLRAKFASDPAPVVMAMSLAVREPGNEFRPGVGTPRSLVSRLSTRFGAPVESAKLFAALSRAGGLWDAPALAATSPPGTWTMHGLTAEFFRVWRTGGVWDEAREEPELYRLVPEQRDASPISRLRDVLVDGLRDMGEGNWVPYNALDTYVTDDPRTPGFGRALRRWAKRVGVDAPEPEGLLRRMVFETLPALGMLDIGEPDGDDEDETTLRVTPRGRLAIWENEEEASVSDSRFVDGSVLRVGGSANLAAVLALGPFVDIGKTSEHLDLVLTNQALARALSAGIESDAVKERIETLAPLPKSLSSLLQKASAVVGRATLARASGFLWVEDTSVREMLASRRQTTDFFVDPSPPAGLLLKPDVDTEKLVRRCRALGVELLHEGRVLRARAVTPPAGTPVTGRRKTSKAIRKPSSSRKSSSTRKAASTRKSR